ALPDGWRSGFLKPRETAARRAAAAIGSGPLLPALPEPGRRGIGFVLPLFALGGVERVVLNQARVLRARGWRTRLVVLGGGGRARLPAEARAAFDDIALLPGREFTAADWRHPYFGAEISGLPRAAAEEAVGLLAGLDAVVNTHSLAGHALMAPLRRLGAHCYAGLHLVERGGWGEAIGTPHSALAYEHAYDGALVISEGLAAWCMANGWPAAKLHLVRNAPGHPTPPTVVTAALAARAARRTGPLRALFLGRLDAQKGMDRLAALVAETRGVVEWRVVGRPVLDVAMPDLGVPVEPPLSDPAALDALYAWADALVLPSRFEGVPLTVLEAQRLGCAVVATDAGETGESITHGEDGFLVPQRGRAEPAIAAELAALLRRLAADPALLLEIGRRAAARVAATGWEETMAGFLQHLDGVVPPGGAG
ncbi:MAG: glycosyltransferase family 4 protein, partial [Acetobacteraceae bacterium]|nr:glycosyltransferase family 4 protein [Acetobacteraceae bacterium]